MITRRTFLASAPASLAAWKKPAGLKIGVMDGVLRRSGKPEAVAAAKALGLEGVQVTLGRANDAGRLPLEDAGLQAAWLAASQAAGVPLDATYLDMLHVDCLKNEPRASTWVARGIEITRKLRAPILMTV